MHWYYLAAAIVFEVAGSTSMKLSYGLSRAGPTTMMFAFYAVAFACNAMALKKLDLSVTYAIWSGLGIVLITAVAWVWQRQVLDTPALLGLGMIMAGVLVIHLFSASVNH